MRFPCPAAEWWGRVSTWLSALRCLTSKLALHPPAHLLVGGPYQFYLLRVGVFHFIEKSSATCLVSLVGATEMESDAARIPMQRGQRFRVPDAVVRFKECLAAPINSCGVG